MSAGRSRILRVCQVLLKPLGSTETFLVRNAKSLPAEVSVIHGPVVAHRDGRPVLSQALAPRAFRKFVRVVLGRPWEWETTASFVRAFRQSHADVVLAEYGETAVLIHDACVRAGVPLVVHFHGYDVSDRHVLETNRAAYARVFQTAAAVIAVSRDMQARLADLGASPSKLHYRPSGVDCEVFAGATPEAAGPIFIAVGRFVDKKGPQLTLRAFSQVVREVPDAHLTMIGDGPLLEECRRLVAELALASNVSLLGSQPHSAVREHMRRARVFVQHSVVAANGDCEGTPNSVLEASACGLPVVSTRHGGIVDAVIDGTTGYLVAEGDVTGMADAMCRLARDASLAGRLGQAGRAFVCEEFSAVRGTARLLAILEEAAIQRRP